MKPFGLIVFLFLGWSSIVFSQKGQVFPLEGKFYSAKPSERIEAEHMRFTAEGKWPFHYLSQEEGLPLNIVLSAHSDSHGFMWFGGLKGKLCRYDGNYFDDFSHLPCFADQNIPCFTNGADGSLWIGTNGHGLVQFDGRSFVEYSDAYGLPGKRLKITTLFTDRHGGIWAGTQKNGVFHIPASDDESAVDSIYHLTSNDGLYGDTFSAISEDQQGAIWFGSWTGNISILRDHQWSYIKKEQGLKPAIIRFMQPYKAGMLIVTSEGIAFYDGASVQYFDEGDGLCSNDCYAVVSEKHSLEDKLWISTLDGYLIEFDGQSFTCYDEKDGIPAGKNTGLGFDPNHELWFGNTASGVFKLENQAFEHHAFASIDQQLPLPKAVVEHDGHLVVANSLGALHEMTRYGLTTDAFASVEENIISLSIDPKTGHLIIGGERGVYAWDGEQIRTIIEAERFMFLTYDAGRIPQYPDYLAIASSAGMWLINENDTIKLTRTNGLNSDQINRFIEHDGYVFCATNDGLAVLPPEAQERFIMFKPDVFEQSAVLNDLMVIGDQLWVAAHGSGVLVVNLDELKTEISAILHQDPIIASEWNSVKSLPDQQVLSFIHSNGTLIASTRKGLVCIEPLSLEIQDVFGTNKELRAKLLATGRAYLDANGKSWWYGDEQLIGLNPSRLHKREALPHVELSQVSLDFEEIDWAGQLAANSFTSTQPELVASMFSGYRFYESTQAWTGLPTKLLLAYDLNHLTFYFEGHDWYNPDELRFSYYLEGFDEGWIAATKDRKVTYQNLPPGQYLFKVKAIGGDGISSQTSSFSFQVQIPFWQSQGFIGLMIILGIIVIFFIFRWRTYRLRKENERLEAKVDERTRQYQQEQRKSESLLLNILPRKTAEELRENGIAEAQSYADVSVLFSDFEGFTHQTETMLPSELVKILDKYFKQWDESLSRYGMEKIKTIGDAYMCAAGLPSTSASHALRTVGYALQMRELTRKINEERILENDHAWKLRIGIHSGPVIAGVVGKKKFAYDIWGDTVNTASRLESHSAPGQINISKSTYEQVKEVVDCHYRGRIEVKGKGGIEMYFVNGFKGAYRGANDQLPSSAFFELLDQEHRSII